MFGKDYENIFSNYKFKTVLYAGNKIPVEWT